MDAAKELTYTWKVMDIKAKKALLMENLRKFVSLICPNIIDFPSSAKGNPLTFPLT
jgi:hypothetical protein